MYAIVDVAGQQFKVENGQKIFVHRISQKEGEIVDIDKVLLIEQDTRIIIGEPVIKGARVSAKVLGHPRGDKVKVFKHKRRKGYKVLNGHRQNFTHLLIESIDEKVPAKKESEKKTVTSKDVSKPEVKKSAEKKTVVKASAAKEAKPETTPGKATTRTIAKKTTGSEVKKEPKTVKTTTAKTTTAKKTASKKKTVTQVSASEKKSTPKTTTKKAPTKSATKKEKK